MNCIYKENLQLLNLQELLAIALVHIRNQSSNLKIELKL